MLPELETILGTITGQYDERREKRTLTANYAAGQRNLCISSIIARMEALDENDEEYRECSFLARSLLNGWTVTDIPMLRDLYHTVHDIPEGRLRSEGEDLLGQIGSMKADTLSARFEMIGLMNHYYFGISRDFDRYKNKMIDFNREQARKTIYPAEYPVNDDFARLSGNNDPENGVSYAQAIDNNQLEEYMSLKAESARTAEEYIFREVSDSERAAEEQRPFVPNEGQSRNGVTKRDSEAVREVLGDSVYDEIDEMRRGRLEDRKVRLHHSLGTKYQKQGHDVLEMEFAGSGGEDVIRGHKDRNGRIMLERLTPDAVIQTYGTKARGANGSEYDFIRYKNRDIKLPDQTTANKTRYTFAGPSPTMFRGIPNFGAYSIESSRENARFFGEQFLAPRFEKWLQGGEKKPVNIILSGHSRGAVTAGQAAKRIDAWISKYIAEHPGAEDFKNYVSYDLTLRDPVPGMVTDLRLGSCNLKNIPNMNAVVFCSTGIEAADMMFPLQHVRGAKKVILTTTGHSMDIMDTDESQKNVFRGVDNAGHMVSYYDSETGEMHRGSGLSEIPDGVYVADEKRNLVRLTSYSQVNDLYGSLYDKSSPQRIRTRRIHKMVRDWFLENELEMSFPDERTRKMEEEKNAHNQDRIMQSTSKRMAPVQEEIRKLRELREKGGSHEQLIKQNKALIEACRTYMKNTAMPPADGSAYRAGLVSDTLSFTMRENNQLNKELSAMRGEVREPGLDEKIKANRERLEKKEGYLGRKKAAEAARLEKQQQILSLIRDTAEKCGNTLKILDNTRKGKSNSTSYDRMHKVLEEGSNLNEQTSVAEMTEFLKRFNDLSESYRVGHSTIIGPRTADGRKRLEQSRLINEYGNSTAAKLQELSKGLGEKNTPVGMRIRNHTANLEHIQTRQTELGAAQRKSAAKAQAQPAM